MIVIIRVVGVVAVVGVGIAEESESRLIREQSAARLRLDSFRLNPPGVVDHRRSRIDQVVIEDTDPGPGDTGGGSAGHQPHQNYSYVFHGHSFRHRTLNLFQANPK